jgi:hypothetical protein
MNRRQFLGLSGLALVIAVLPSSEGPASPVPDYACHPKDIPPAAIIGDCYVNRGTYAGWTLPGVPPVAWNKGMRLT